MQVHVHEANEGGWLNWTSDTEWPLKAFRAGKGQKFEKSGILEKPGDKLGHTLLNRNLGPVC